MCHECIHVTKSGRGNSKILGRASRAIGWTPLSKFLDPPLNFDSPGLIWAASDEVFDEDFEGGILPDDPVLELLTCVSCLVIRLAVFVLFE